MISDRLQYFLNDFWNDPKCDQIWTVGPRIYHQNTSKNTRIYVDIFENYYFVISENLKFWNLWKVYVPNLLELWNLEFLKWKYGTWKFDICKFWNLKILKFWKMKILKFGNWKAWELETCNLETWNLANCKFWKFENMTFENWNLKIGNMEVWKLEIRKFENRKFEIYPSTCRLPSLHPTTFLEDTMSSAERQSSELRGNEWAWRKNHLISLPYLLAFVAMFLHSFTASVNQSH